jgi:ABC-type ATPase with predicted acetyltransferase domain
MSDLAQTSIYLNMEDRQVAEELMQRMGLSRSALFRLALHRLNREDDGNRRERLLEMAEELKSLA